MAAGTGTGTGFHPIKGDTVNAGATLVDKEVVVEGDVITGRQPDDLSAFTVVRIEAVGAKQ